MLMAYDILRMKREQEEREAEFERDLFLAQPEAYQEYKKKQKEEEILGNKGVQWLVPETPEEIDALKDVFADLDKQIKEDPEYQEQQSRLQEQISLVTALEGINIEEIGDSDDGQ